jgi:hypothetical protein
MNDIEKIKNVLRKYFEYDDHGNPNEEYDPDMYPQDALDEIHEIVGKI